MNFTIDQKKALFDAWTSMKNLDKTPDVMSYFETLLSAYDLYCFLRQTNGNIEEKIAKISGKSQAMFLNDNNHKIPATNMNCVAFALFGITPDVQENFNSNLFLLYSPDVQQLLAENYSKKNLTDIDMNESNAEILFKNWLAFFGIIAIEQPRKVYGDRKIENGCWEIAYSYSLSNEDYHFYRKAQNGKWYAKRGWENGFEICNNITELTYAQTDGFYYVLGKYILTHAMEPSKQLKEIEFLLEQIAENSNEKH